MRYERGIPEESGCVIETDVGGKGQEASILPGEQVTITFDCQIWRIPTRVPICQIVAGIGDNPVYGCLYNAVPPPYPGTSFRKTFGFVSANPDVFEVCVHWDRWYTCEDAIAVYPARRKVAATIEVVTPTPEIPALWILGPTVSGTVMLAASK